MKRTLLAAAVAGVAALVVVSGAHAGPVKSAQAHLFEATCTGLGNVTLANTLPAHTEALHVVGANTVVLVSVEWRTRHHQRWDGGGDDLHLRGAASGIPEYGAGRDRQQLMTLLVLTKHDGIRLAEFGFLLEKVAGDHRLRRVVAWGPRERSTARRSCPLS